MNILVVGTEEQFDAFVLQHPTHPATRSDVLPAELPEGVRCVVGADPVEDLVLGVAYFRWPDEGDEFYLINVPLGNVLPFPVLETHSPCVRPTSLFHADIAHWCRG